MRRFSRQTTVPFRRLSFSGTGSGSLESHPWLGPYLEGANISFSALGDVEKIRAQIVQFPQISFARVRLPDAVIEWPRDAMSMDRGVVLAVTRGAFAVETSSPVLTASPGLFLIPPGATHVRLRALEPVNDVVYISMSVAVLRAIEMPDGPPKDRNHHVDPAALAPLLAFIDALCASTIETETAVDALRSSAIQVAVSLGALIADDGPSRPDAYESGMQVIAREYAKPRLTVGTIAAAVGVADRTLHAAFARRGTTVAGELRAARVRAAREIRERNPGIRRGDLALAAGFGSISSMQRAMRSDEGARQA